MRRESRRAQESVRVRIDAAGRVLLVQHHGEFLAADVEGTKLLIEMLEPHCAAQPQRPNTRTAASGMSRRPLCQKS